MKSKLLPFLVALLISSNVSATVDYLVVNHITDQLYWAKTDHPPGWIGWQTIPDGIWEREERKYLDMGYTFTENPYLIEEIIAIFIIVL